MLPEGRTSDVTNQKIVNLTTFKFIWLNMNMSVQCNSGSMLLLKITGKCGD